MRSVTILVKGSVEESEAAQRALTYLNNSIIPASQRFFASNVEVKSAEFTFKELNDWRDKIMKPIFGINGVSSLDLAEDKNRIVIGIVDPSYELAVESVLSDLNIPLEAVSTKIRGKLVSQVGFAIPEKRKNYGMMDTNELDNRYRPVKAGTRLGTCTLGILAKWGNENVFLTNSHCSDAYGPEDPPADFNQPDQLEPNDLIGYELYDPSFETNNRESDATISEYVNGVTGEYGTIVRTTGRSFEWQISGSKDIYDQDPDFDIIKDDRVPIINMEVTKTGWITGATVGLVSETCTDFSPLDSGITIHCQYVAEPLYNGSGDSGSPVFYDGEFSNAQEGEVELIGIFHGKPQNEEAGIFSGMEGIRLDLETSNKKLYTIPGIDVSISGPGNISSSGTYTWDATVGNAEGTINYQWSIKYEGSSSWQNLGTSTSQDVFVGDETNFDIKVDVSDATSSGFDIMRVNVSFDCDPWEPCGN